MTVLRRIGSIQITPGRPPTPGTPGRFVEVADTFLPADTAQRLNGFGAFGATGGGGSLLSGEIISQTGPSTSSGGSSSSSSTFYSATSLNGQPGAYVFITTPDGRTVVIRA